MSDEGEWSDAERQALARLERTLSAPSEIESRIVAELRSRGVLRSPYRRSLQVTAAAAVVMAALIAGALLDRSLTRRALPGARFMLLLYGGAEDPTRRGEYAAWARSVASSGVGISGEELSHAAEATAAIPPGPLSADSLPRGYFIVSTSSLDDARRIASTCPHLRHGGRIVVREIIAGP